jgi:hypothetical protein
VSNRTKLLIHFRRLPNLLSKAFEDGAAGTLDDKYAAEHPEFVHHACAFYLIGILAYLEGEGGKHSWNKRSERYGNFDFYVQSCPLAWDKKFSSKGINTASLQALADIRNAVVHNEGDLSRVYRAAKVDVVNEVLSLNIPGVVLTHSMVTLNRDFLEFVRQAGLAVRMYCGES